MQEVKENKVEVIGRLIPNSGKIHQNQEVYNILGVNVYDKGNTL